MGKRLIIKGADFNNNGITAYKYIQVSTKQVVTVYLNNKLNVHDVIDVSVITTNEEYFIKVTSKNNKFTDIPITLIGETNSSFNAILSDIIVGKFSSFTVKNIPDRFWLQSKNRLDDNYVNSDDTLTISIYKKQESA